jgi:hypothetical protein
MCHPADALAADAHFVKPIEHAAKETNRLLQIDTTQQVKVAQMYACDCIVCE